MFLNNRMLSLLGTAVLSLAFASTPLSAAEHRHDHGHDSAPAKLALNNGKKWETDAPLRQGMQSIRKLMDASQHDIHEGRLSAAKYGELAKKVNAEVGGIVANCKLEPKADAQLHLVIADILEGVEAMDGGGKKAAMRHDGAVKVIAALENYAAHFAHPGWKPVKH